MLKTILTILKKGSYFSIFFVISLVFFSLFILIQVFSVTGNDLAFQLSTFSFGEYTFMILLALLIGLTFSLQIYTFKNKKSCSATGTIAQGAATGISGAFGAVIGTAFCASCLLPLFAAIGLGGSSVFFVLEHQLYFLAGAVALILVSLYFALRKATNTYKQSNH